MKIVSVGEAKARFSAYLKTSKDGPVIVTRNGRPVAVLIGVTDEQDSDLLVLTHTPRFRRLLKEARSRIVKTGGLNDDEFWDTLG